MANRRVVGSNQNLPGGFMATLAQKVKEANPRPSSQTTGDADTPPKGFWERLQETLSNLNQKLQSGIGAARESLHGGVLGSLKSAITAPNVEQGAASAFQGLSQLSEKLGPAGKIIKPLAEFGETLAKSLDNLRKWSRELLDSQLDMAQFSAGMAQVKAEQDIRDIQLTQRKGDMQSGSARDLAESMSELNNTLAPLESAFKGLQNEVFSKIIQLVNLAVKLSGIVEPIQYIAEKMGLITKEGEADTGVKDWLMKQGEESAAAYARPARFNGRGP